MRGSLFTFDFLERGIRETDVYRGLDDATFADRLAKLRRLFTEFPVTMVPNEPETEARLISPIADLIGWTHRQVQQGLETQRRNIPDALLFLSEADRRAADHEATQEAIVERKDRDAHGCYLTAELIVWYMRALAAGDVNATADEATLIRAATNREDQKPTKSGCRRHSLGCKLSLAVRLSRHRDRNRGAL